MTITRSTWLGLAIALALVGEPALAASQDDAPTGDKASNALYWQGQAALKQSDWSTALQRFQDLEKLLRKNEPKSVDAALYWEAYALVQAKRTSEAKGVIERLRREFPDSRWGRDADGLLAQTRPATKLDPSTGRAGPTEEGSHDQQGPTGCTRVRPGTQPGRRRARTRQRGRRHPSRQLLRLQ